MYRMRSRGRDALYHGEGRQVSRADIYTAIEKECKDLEEVYCDPITMRESSFADWVVLVLRYLGSAGSCADKKNFKDYMRCAAATIVLALEATDLLEEGHTKAARKADK